MLIYMLICALLLNALFVIQTPIIFSLISVRNYSQQVEVTSLSTSH